jgi:hypothetical protein
MKTLYSLIALLFIATYSLHAQEKKTLYQLDANAQLHDDGSIYHSGVGFSAGAYYPISPSFNMGPTLAADFISAGNPSRSYNPISVRFTTLWFPEKLLNSIVPASFWRIMCFKAGLGHSFNYDSSTDKMVINSAYFDLAMMFPVKTRNINVHLGLTAIAVKNYIGGSQPNATLTTLGVGYNLFKYKTKTPVN